MGIRLKALDQIGPIFVINLARRKDRLARMRARLGALGKTFTRVGASDGREPAIEDAFRRYCEQLGPRMRPEEVPPDSRSFFLGCVDRPARIAFLQEKQNRKGLASAGALANLMSMETALVAGLASGSQTFTIMEDDCVFHRNTEEILSAAMAELHDRWLILQLGAFQYRWEPAWADFVGNHAYRNNGAVIGTHAVVLRRPVVATLLERTRDRTLPFDIGAMSETVQIYREASFVVYPNVAIQEMHDSDINSSRHDRASEREELFNTYRWQSADYDWHPRSRSPARIAKPPRRNVTKAKRGRGPG